MNDLGGKKTPQFSIIPGKSNFYSNFNKLIQSSLFYLPLKSIPIVLGNANRHHNCFTRIT
jgi:hypothetical protein